MADIKAIVRNGQLVVDGPINLPDGTELTIPLPKPRIDSDAPPDTPETIEAWLRWYDALEPLEFTADERAAWERARKDVENWRT